MKKYQSDQLALVESRRQEESGLDDEEYVRQIDMIRPLDDSDIDKVKSSQSVEEFLDCYHHFQLHYGNNLLAMKEQEAKKSKPAKKRINEDGEEEEIVDEDELPAEDPNFVKYASKKDRYYQCKQAGLNTLAKKFGLSAEHFGENLIADYQQHDIDQWNVMPNLLAMDYVREPYFQKPEQVLATARYMVGVQIARDPTVRQYVRDLYVNSACITVHPTMPRGFKEIDETHPCFAFKYLKMKPVSDLRYDMYLKLWIAEQDGLLTIKFEPGPIKQMHAEPIAVAPEKAAPSQPTLPPEDDWDDEPRKQLPAPVVKPPPKSNIVSVHKTINEKLKAFYQKDEFSYNVEQWNMQRAQVIDELCAKILFPEFERELRSKLLYEAKRHVLEESARQLNGILRVAPYRTEFMQNVEGVSELSERGLKVLAIAYSANQEGSEGPMAPCMAIGAYVDGNGDLDEFMKLRNFNLRVFRGKEGEIFEPGIFMAKERQEKLDDMKKLEEMIISKKPNVIVVSAENKDALVIVDELKIMLQKMIESNEQLGEISVELVDNEMAKLFESSKVSEQEFGVNVSGMVRHAVGLARCIQDPMLAYSQLFNHERDVLALKLHPMQQSLINLGKLRSSIEIHIDFFSPKFISAIL